jgi:hypothetical protein
MILRSPFQKPPIGAQFNRNHPLTQGMIGCWVMNERAGRRLMDYSGYGKHGTLINMAVPWKESGLYFGGGGVYDRVQLPSILTKPPYTIIARINPVSCGTVNEGNGLVYQGSANGDLGTVLSIVNATGVDNYVSFKNKDGNWVGSDANTVIPGVFQQIAVSINVAGVATLYNNKTVIKIGSSGTNILNNNPTYIGFWYKVDGNTRFFNGVMDYVYIYNRDLSAYEIESIYSNPYCIFDEMQYPLGGGEEPPVEPETGGGFLVGANPLVGGNVLCGQGCLIN